MIERDEHDDGNAIAGAVVGLILTAGVGLVVWLTLAAMR